jgi:hypothetical protein
VAVGDQVAAAQVLAEIAAAPATAAAGAQPRTTGDDR